jgi:hypothetical protein
MLRQATRLMVAQTRLSLQRASTLRETADVNYPFRTYRPNVVIGNVSDHAAQATGMIAAQAGCGVEEALHRLIIRAEAMGQTIDDTALDVLDGIIRFDE